MKKFVLLFCAMLLVANVTVSPNQPMKQGPETEVAFLAPVREETTYMAAATATSDAKKKTAPSVELSQNESQPGETIFITLRHIKDVSTVKVKNDFGFNVRFTPVDADTMVGFLPLSYFTTPGAYTLSVTGGGLPQEGISFSLKVNPKEFDLQELTVKEEVANDTIFNDDASVEYRKKIWPMKDVYDDARYFDGRFIRPLTGEPPITTEFGMMRTVNGKANPRHDGIDLSAGTGTPIRAAQNGRVIFSDFVKLTGNTIIIEHGAGLKSWYQHLDTLNVEPDEMVETGDLIGTVGSTGFVTGPHLHFSASINGVYINPFTLSDTNLLELAAGIDTPKKSEPTVGNKKKT